MRILRVSYRIPPQPGGKESHVDALTQAQLDMGHRVEVLYALGSVVPQGATAVKMAKKVRHARLNHICFALAAGFHVLRRAGGYDTVHLHGDFVEVLPIGIAARTRGVPLVCTVHGGLAMRYRRVARWIFALVDAFIALGDTPASQLRLLRVPDDRVLVSHSGVDLKALAELRNQRQTCPGRIVSVGSLDPVKGHDTLIRTVLRMADAGSAVELLIVGDGPDRKRLTALAAGRDEIKFLGMLPHEDVVRVLLTANAFALGSRNLGQKAEGVPTAALEAMALGLPCVVSEAASLSPAVKDQTAYLMVLPDDIQAWHQALTSILDDVETADNFSRRAVHAAAHLDWSEVAHTMTSHYPEHPLEGGEDSRLRVTEVVRTLDIGGVETLLATRLRVSDHRSVAYQVLAVQAANDQLAARIRSLGVPVHVLSRRCASVGLLRMFWKLWRSNADVLSVHSPLPAACSRVANTLARIRVNPIQVTTVHNTSFRPFVAWLDRRTHSAHEVIVTVSDAVARSRVCAHYPSLLTRMGGVDVNEMRRLSTDRDRTRASLGLGRDIPVLAHVAGLRPAKDHAVALQAYASVARRIPDAIFLMVGDGPLREGLIARAQALGLQDRVRFLGLRSDAKAVVAAADVVALSSRHEGLPVVVMEALAAGVPVVSTDVGGVGELVTDGENGLLTPPGDPEAFAAAIEQVLSGRLFAADAFAQAAERLNISEVARWYEDLYHGVAHSSIKS